MTCKHKNKIRLLFVAEELSTNGAMKSLIALLNALDSDKYDISLFLFWHRKGGLSEQLPEHVNVLPELPQYRALRMPLKDALKESCRKARFDLVCFRSLVALQRYRHKDFSLWSFLPEIPGEYDIACSYADGFVAPLILKKASAAKTVCWIHYLYTMVPQPQYVYNALRRCSACVPVSREAGKALEQELGQSVNKHIVHNLTDAVECRRLAEMVNDYPRQDGCYRIVSIGRVTDAKRFDVIPETADILRKRGVMFEWIIVGSGDKLAEVSSNVAALQLEKEVKMVGELSNPFPLLKSADIFVNPSRHESWGMTVSEALCLGKPVITSDIPVFAEQITTGVNGLMVAPAPQKITQAICDIIADNDLRKRLEENALHYPFTKQRVVDEFDNMVNTLLIDK